MSETYARDSKASNKNALSDMYVKFFRWAIDRVNNRDGIVSFVSNNSFVEQTAFDGMRKHLAHDFTRLYHLHLEGNVRQNPTLSGTAYNVFGIQVGVGITVAVRSQRRRGHRVLFHRVEKTLRRHKKLDWLAQHGDVQGVKWQTLKPDGRQTWLPPKYARQFASLVPVGTKEAKSANSGHLTESIFSAYSGGVKTNRDDVVYDFSAGALLERVNDFIDAYNAEVDRHKRKGENVGIDGFVRYDRIKWSESLKANVRRHRYAEIDETRVRTSLYRPFTRRFLYFDPLVIERRYQLPLFFPTLAAQQENLALALTGLASEKPFMTLVMNGIADFHLVGGGASAQCFPFYVYDDDGRNRRENVTDWALKHFRENYRQKKITKWDIFYYVYGVLHHPGYRERYAENLKRDLPRIPLAPDFRSFASAGKELARLHLDYEKLEPRPLKWIESPGVPLSYRVEDKMRLGKDKTALKVNDSLTLAGIPPEVFNYRLGNRSALEWIIDQYHVTEDQRSGIRSDPNRPDDLEYIVRLLGQVVRVSVETVGIVENLPPDFGGGR